MRSLCRDRGAGDTCAGIGTFFFLISKLRPESAAPPEVPAPYIAAQCQIEREGPHGSHGLRRQGRETGRASRLRRMPAEQLPCAPRTGALQGRGSRHLESTNVAAPGPSITGEAKPGHAACEREREVRRASICPSWPKADGWFKVRAGNPAVLGAQRP